jgi:hypothetical protein
MRYASDLERRPDALSSSEGGVLKTP